MASPAFISAGAELEVTTGSGVYTGNVAVPAGVADGDFLVLVVRDALADATIATPAGWISISAHEKTSVSQTDLRVFYRIASSEPGTYGISVDGNAAGNNAFHSQMFAYDPATVDTSGVWEGSGASTTIANPSLTSGGADRTLICIYGQYGNASGGITYTAPSGMTERANQNCVFAGPVYSSFGVADKAISSAGATGTQNATASDGAPWHLGFSLLIVAAGGGGGGSSAGAAAHYYRQLMG